MLSMLKWLFRPSKIQGKGIPMKNFALTALIAAAIVVPIIMKMKKEKQELIPLQMNENIRYDINDYMESQGL